MGTKLSASDLISEDFPFQDRATSGPTASEGEASLLDLSIVLAERKSLILWMTLTFAVLSIVISLLLPKRYTATVTLLPPQQSTSLSSTLASQLSGLGGMASLASSSLGLKNPNDMYVGMMKSRTVEDAMIQHFGLMQEYKTRYLSDARKTLENRVSILGNSKDGLIRISVEDGSPERAAELANGYVEEYSKLSDHLAITEAAQRRLFFEQQLEKTKNDLATAEEALKSTEQKSGLIQLDSQARALIESAATLRAQVAAKEVQIEAMRTYATGENAQVIEAEQELVALRAQLAKLGGAGDSASDDIIVSKGRVPEAGLEYVRKVRDVKYYETIFNILAREFEAAKLDEARQGAVIQIVDAAVPPDKRSFPKRTQIVTLITAFGLLMGLFAAFLQRCIQRIKEDAIAAPKLRLLVRTLTASKSEPLSENRKPG
jgi:uncharacterized protein involved in exopolysaccharide biosynthesis